VQRVTVETRRESINPDQSVRVVVRPATIDVPQVRVVVRPATIDVPQGALFVPMNQPSAGIVAAALEPDSPGSYLGVGMVPMNDNESEAPVYRVMTDRRFCSPH